MNSLRTTFVFVSVAVLAPRPALGQLAPTAPPATNSLPPLAESDARKWAFSASTLAYFIPDSREVVQPTLSADRDWLHLEARYNYENLETGSAWLGYNWSGGKKLTWEFTPMLGGVFGNTTGIAAGYKGALSWWKFALSSEGECVVDSGESSGSFLYNWSELTLNPWEWLRFGLVTQRTRVYHTDRDIQRGILVGFSWKQVSLTTYVLNPDESKPTLVLGLGVEF